MHYVSKWGLRHKVPGEVQTVCETSYTNTLFTFVPYMCLTLVERRLCGVLCDRSKK